MAIISMMSFVQSCKDSSDEPELPNEENNSIAFSHFLKMVGFAFILVLMTTIVFSPILSNLTVSR